MSENFDELAERLSFIELVRLQDTLSRSLVRRFEKRQALAFSDVVGSTAYFARFGDEAGRKLQQRHVDLVRAALKKHAGRLVDTAGDGVFMCFQSADEALRALVSLQESIAADNDSRGVEHRLRVHCGAHHGPVLTDGIQVSGDAVNLCSRIASSADLSEVRLSAQAFSELTEVGLRMRCRRLGSVEFKGVDRPIEVLSLEWRDPRLFPSLIRFEDGSATPLPRLEVVRFGRLREQDGVPANEVVLTADGEQALHRISRWHFELHLRSTGYWLRPVSSATTELDGVEVQKGEEKLVKAGCKVRVGGVLTIEFTHPIASGEETFLPTR